MSKPDTITLMPMDIDSHRDTIVAYRWNMLEIAFDHSLNFTHEMGFKANKYLSWLYQTTRQNPEFCQHIMAGQDIIGQVEMDKRHVDDECVGMVHGLYIDKTHRGKGYAKKAMEKIFDFWDNQNDISKIVLSVSKTNHRAKNFYEKTGWQNHGDDPDDARTFRMVYTL